MAKLALVTGGTRGIGAAVSVALKQAGYRVAASYHGNDAKASAFKAETGIDVFKFDVADFDAAAAGVAAIEKEMGAPVEILVNNAGITRDGFFHKMTAAQWRELMATNLDSVFNVTRPVIEGMRARGFGRIINISSINGQAGQIGQANYAAAKAGVIGFTKALALESAGKGITVNVVAPGYIDTDMVQAVPAEVLQAIVGRIPAKRLGKPEEIAACVAFLASDAAAFMNGATLSVNGGQYMA